MKLIKKKYDNLTLIGLFDSDNKPILLKVQRQNALNYGQTTQGKIIQKNNTLRGYFIETEQKQPVFAPSQKKLSIGETVYIQITKEARMGKDATGVITDSAVTTANNIHSATLDDIFINPNKNDIQTDDENLISSELIDEILETEILFAEGAKIHIERTNVCWTFDVDSAQSTLPLSTINEKACCIIAKQILLKNLSGIILIDFAGYKDKKSEEKLTLTLLQYIGHDTRSKIFGFTKTKLCEIRRTRTTASLHDIFLTPQNTKNPTLICMEIEDRLKRRFTSTPELCVHPCILSHLTDKIKNQCVVKTDFNLNEDNYVLKGE